MILLLKNKKLIIIKNKAKKLFSFELSKRNATLAIIIIFSLYTIATINELDDEENLFSDSSKVVNASNNYELTPTTITVKYFLLQKSIQIFDNIKIIPFVASLGLLLITYFLAREFTKKRFAGVISILVILQSSLFLKYDTIATYENFWLLFYFTSIY